ncbi:MAG: alpha/beta hydrolase, partial [Bacteroidales bacterium]
MKRFIFLNICLWGLCYFSIAQDITGVWMGTLRVQNTELRLVLHINLSGMGYIATMDSPDQGVYGIKVETIIMKDSLLSLKIPKLYMEYKGRYLSQDKIKGQFKQNGILIPLVLERSTSTDLTKTQVLRPQTPVKPYPYYNEEVVFDNTEANIHLAGTLS